MIEASMVFAVCPVNIYSILKVISLLGAMHLVITLPAKKSPVQYVMCDKWGYKKDNYVKHA